MLCFLIKLTLIPSEVYKAHVPYGACEQETAQRIFHNRLHLMLFSLWRLLLDLADRAKSKLGVDLVLKDECFATFAFDYFYFNNRDFFFD